jgi:hypothetical protein
MELHGLPETFWLVTKPSPVSELGDVCFPCTVGELMLRTLGGLQADDIVGVYADENQAKEAAKRSLDETAVTPTDALAVEVLVPMLVVPTTNSLAKRALAQAAVEAVRNAVARAEQVGFEHRLKEKVTIGSGPVKLHEVMVLVG